MMNRNLSQLTNNTYDLLIIGGGIYGACLTWEASSRGLSVALVEKSDFGSATSANSLKVIHGGLRYLQHADFKRARISVGERKNLLRIAPHLVHPLPVLIPAYGYGMKGRAVLSVGLAINDVVGFDRNQLADPQKHIPRGRTISKKECLRLLPNIQQQGLTGGAIFYDAQVHNSERLPLAFLQTAAQAGAHVVNYVEVTDFLKTQSRITGVQAKDVLTGNMFDIRAKLVINTSGPWINNVLGLLNGHAPQPPVQLAKAINLVVHPLFNTYAFGISSPRQYKDDDALINKGSRFFFVVPWRERSMIGTEYIPYNGHPDALCITNRELQNFLDDFNLAYPSANLKKEDVSFVHTGLVPISEVHPQTGSVQLTKHHKIYNHQKDGLDGLISVTGVKYTTARHVAETVIDQISEKWNKPPKPSTSATTRLYGGQIDNFDAFLQNEIAKKPCGLNKKIVTKLIYTYGSAYSNVLQHFERNHQTVADELAILGAETLYAVRNEMAQKLSDVIFRRTETGTADHPGEQTLKFSAELMAEELQWSKTRIQQEINQINQKFVWND